MSEEQLLMSNITTDSGAHRFLQFIKDISDRQIMGFHSHRKRNWVWYRFLKYRWGKHRWVKIVLWMVNKVVSIGKNSGMDSL
jgi:hypothetical protein